jgi:hypothetical protein
LREFTPKLSPTLEQLLHTAHAASDDDNRRELEEAIHVTAQQIHEARCNEEAAVNKLLQEWCSGAVGYIPSEKPEELTVFDGSKRNTTRLPSSSAKSLTSFMQFNNDDEHYSQSNTYTIKT